MSQLTHRELSVLSTGIGRALCLHLNTLNASVVAISKSYDRLKTLQMEAPSICIVAVDLRDWDATKTALESLPAPHGVVNNAGVAVLRPILELEEKDFDR